LAIAFWIDVPHWLMSQRADYLRDQADKLQWHAERMTDAETKEQLRKLAIEYIERAALVEVEGRQPEVKPANTQCSQ
jgi:hypothetical protein